MRVSHMRSVCRLRFGWFGQLNHQVEAQCFQIETLQQQENNTLKLAQETEAKGAER